MSIIEDNISVAMRRETLDDVPEYSLPPEYSLRLFQPGDEAHWLAIHRRADAYNTFTPHTFAQQFGHDEAILRQRQYYLCAGAQVIGTATAWWDDDFEGARWGRVHWVAIVPEFQGRGLARPLLSQVCRRLRALGHERLYLTTSTARVPAIHLYLKFGFIPHVRSDEEARVWREMQAFLET